jgi:hypothetical protein
MRKIMACAALMVLVAASSEAQNSITPAKEAVTDATIINLCGARLSKLFAQLGPPENVRPERGDKPEEDDVFFDYGAAGFGCKVRNKAVPVCFFFKDWKGTVRGIKIGDSREDVVKVLGNATTTVKDKNGVITAYGYDLKELDAYFFANVDETGKVWRVEVSLK